MARTEKGIYYNYNYETKADVLQDMKLMAESIDETIDNNSYNDTEIKKDISDLQQEQITQNTQIVNLQQATATSNVVLIENLAYVYKFGKVVNLIIFGTKELAVNNKANVTLTTLPEGYRPRYDICIPIILKDSSWNFINNSSMIIRTNGTVEISQASGQNVTANQILANCTFITN